METADRTVDSTDKAGAVSMSLSTSLLALPCPFCGRGAVMVPGLHSSIVECRNGGCGVRPFAEAADIKTAVDAWNTRANAGLDRPAASAGTVGGVVGNSGGTKCG